eukprot:31314-Pelagococcus_subviridis.AAC.27
MRFAVVTLVSRSSHPPFVSPSSDAPSSALPLAVVAGVRARESDSLRGVAPGGSRVERHRERADPVRAVPRARARLRGELLVVARARPRTGAVHVPFARRRSKRRGDGVHEVVDEPGVDGGTRARGGWTGRERGRRGRRRRCEEKVPRVAPRLGRGPALVLVARRVDGRVPEPERDPRSRRVQTRRLRAVVPASRDERRARVLRGTGESGRGRRDSLARRARRRRGGRDAHAVDHPGRAQSPRGRGRQRAVHKRLGRGRARRHHPPVHGRVRRDIPRRRARRRRRGVRRGLVLERGD